MSLEQKISKLTPAKIEALIAESTICSEVQPSHGHQATVHRVELAGTAMVVKSVTRQRSSLVWLRRRMLVNEYRVYQRLSGLTGTPRCYGLIEGQYLLLEYIDGKPFGDVSAPLDSDIYKNLLALIKGLHQRGVAHGDLKQKTNLILGADGNPYLVDFGTAIVRKRGFRPLNNFLFQTARQLDYHGYIKNKYRGRRELIHESDQAYYRPMRTEQFARWFRRTFRHPLNALREKHARN